ncbi:hypothetical protein [Phytopseudomonas seleniipraecipitans]|uniref:Uncharacterized protein n=1 Tax=Phytopseudomonas seleniipraecipitans TaxID=640205 RepID=A0A1G7KKQ0_9GAMM|nr:hypothetical protein [Pseudomonas seleniipraecipitans]SDF37735.1 hypothetical protein SAMN05216381_1547 [Pseudomonas seleniipraecipitans]
MNSSHAQKQTVKEILLSLHEKFGQNINSLEGDPWEVIEKIDMNSRIISEIRTILSDEHCDTEGQSKICSELLEEVFSDFSLAMYLCSIGLIVQARMSVRRAFEIGLATVYMWDLPHEYWGWRSGDQDLSFSAMVTHLNSCGYSEYIKHIRGGDFACTICDQSKFQKIYRELSNTVHGKISELPPLSPERFLPNRNGVIDHLTLTASAQRAVIELLLGRFSGLREKIEDAFPAIKRN